MLPSAAAAGRGRLAAVFGRPSRGAGDAARRSVRPAVRPTAGTKSPTGARRDTQRLQLSQRTARGAHTERKTHAYGARDRPPLLESAAARASGRGKHSKKPAVSARVWRRAAGGRAGGAVPVAVGVCRGARRRGRAADRQAGKAVAGLTPAG